MVDNEFYLKKIVPTTFFVAGVSLVISAILDRSLLLSLILGFAFTLFAHNRRMKAFFGGSSKRLKLVAFTNYLLQAFLVVISFFSQEQLNPFVVLLSSYTANIVLLATVFRRATRRG